MVPPSTSASVTGSHNVSGEDEEEGKEAEPLSGGTSTRSPVPGQPIVDGTPSAAVNPSSDERRENATAGGRVGSSVGDGDGNSSAGGAGEDHLGEVALETDRYSVAALGRGVSRTGYRLKGIVVSLCQVRNTERGRARIFRSPGSCKIACSGLYRIGVTTGKRFLLSSERVWNIAFCSVKILQFARPERSLVAVSDDPEMCVSRFFMNSRQRVPVPNLGEF